MCYMYLKKNGQKGEPKELQASSQSLRDHGANPPRSHVQAHEGQDSVRGQPEPINQGKTVTGLLNCVL